MNRIVTLIAGGVAVCALVLAMLVAAFDDESSATAKRNFCQSTTELSEAVADFDALDPATATIDEIDDAADAVDDAWRDVMADADDLAEAVDDDLALAYDDLYRAVESIPGDATVAEGLASVEDELAAFPQALTATFDGRGCSTV